MIHQTLTVAAVLVSLCVYSTDQGCLSKPCPHLSNVPFDQNENRANDISITIEEHINQFGYPAESHDITTEDGYILTYHRIPHGKSRSLGSAQRRPVLLQHGLLGGSPIFISYLDALAFSLADAGFDVWLANARGNCFSRRHTLYNADIDKREFWNFSWHEIGFFDLPASIDYILNITHHQQLFYLGYSLGTTEYFVMGATRPEYMAKVAAMLGFGIIAFPWHSRSPVPKILNNLQIIIRLVSDSIDYYEVVPSSNATFWLLKNACYRPLFNILCKDFIYYFIGTNDELLNKASVKEVIKFCPCGTSYKVLQHFKQICKKEHGFRQYNYGDRNNQMIYGTTQPPHYNLTNVRAPTYVYYSTNDWLADPKDVLFAVDQLPNVKKVTKVASENFNHMDFLWGGDVKTLLYQDLISTLHSLPVT